MQGTFPTMIGLVTLGHLLYTGMQKRWSPVTKPIMVGKHPVNCCVQVCNTWLNIFALADITTSSP